MEGIDIRPHPYTFFEDINLMLPLKKWSIRSLQVKDAEINSIL